MDLIVERLISHDDQTKEEIGGLRLRLTRLAKGSIFLGQVLGREDDSLGCEERSDSLSGLGNDELARVLVQQSSGRFLSSQFVQSSFHSLSLDEALEKDLEKEKEKEKALEKALEKEKEKRRGSDPFLCGLMTRNSELRRELISLRVAVKLPMRSCVPSSS